MSVRTKSSGFVRALVAAGTTTALVVAGLVATVAVAAPAAAADVQTSVSADALPTAQMNGVVWDQAIAGNTVFAGGEFTSARPPGASPGTSETTRNNLMAYNLTTGALLSFNPNVNGKVSDMAVTPDGTKLFVVGTFTQVGGVARNRVAVYDLPGLTLSALNPNVNGPVDSVAVSNSRAFFGGNFSSIAGQGRNKFGGITFSGTTVSMLAISPTFPDGRVTGIVLNPDASKVAISGNFTAVNGSSDPGYGIYMMDAVSGAQLALPVNSVVRDAGPNSSVRRLATDGTYFYGTGWHYSSAGSTESMWAARWSDGSFYYQADCHGDTYDVYAGADAVYVASHTHSCVSSEGFNEWVPRAYMHSTAFSKTIEGQNRPDAWGYPDNDPRDRPDMLNWFPQYEVGTFTGQSQATWAVTGNSDYVVYGGEFLRVNGQAQQGIVRFAKRSIAPNDQGPRTTSASWDVRALSQVPGTVHVSFSTNWDRDDETLVYRVYRGSESTTPILTQTVKTTFWNPQTLTAVDRGRPAGAQETYRVTATDANGNVGKSDWVTATVASTAVSAYVGSVLDSGAASWWRLGETSGAAADSIAGDPLTTVGSVTRNVAGAINGDANRAMTFSGASSQYAYSSVQTTASDDFTVEAWFKTANNYSRGGKIIGFGTNQTGGSGQADRHVYMNNQGRLYFGVRGRDRTTINTTTAYNDGQWHHVVASMGPDGMKLSVDGQLRVSNTTMTAGRNYLGYWRVGGDSLSNWSSRPSSDYFAGTIDEPAVYVGELSASEIAAHYTAGTSGAAGNQAPTAAYTFTPTNLSVAFDGRSSSDVDGTIANYLWEWGDGTANTSGTNATPTHVFAAAGTYQVKLTVRDDDDATHSVTLPVEVTAAPANTPPTAAYTFTPTNLSVAFNGSTSTDPGGSIASYSWAWDDGTPNSTGATPTHVFPAAGSYDVTLTVTDNGGLTDTETKTVTVTAAPPAGSEILATDLFERTATGSWGSATPGGAWTLAGTASGFSVAGGAGRISTPLSTGQVATLGSVSSTNTLITTEFSVDKVALGQYILIHGRTVAGTSYSLRIMVDTATTAKLWLLRGSSTAIGASVTVPLTWVANDKYMVEFEVTGNGTTTLNSKVWKSGTTEPAAWQKSGTDSTAAMQAPGSVGVESRIPGTAAGAGQVPVVISFHSITVNDPNIP
ncbi:MAG: PKD domain-containing protein [Mycetocola sp.]